MELKDYGKDPFVINIEDATLANENFRLALWTGTDLQITLMTIAVGSEIGAEIHDENDQFLRIEQGHGEVIMGSDADNITFKRQVGPEDVILIPKGVFHNLINTGDQAIKLYSIYGPAHHEHGTIHETKEIADEAEAHEHHHH